MDSMLHRRRSQSGHGETADQRLDRLLAEQDAERASSMPEAGLRRLHGEGGDGRARDGAGTTQQVAAPTYVVAPAVEEMLNAPLLNDPRVEGLGLGALQDAVRQSLGVLQQALGRHPGGPGLLDGLAGGRDPRVQGLVGGGAQGVPPALRDGRAGGDGQGAREEEGLGSDRPGRGRSLETGPHAVAKSSTRARSKEKDGVKEQPQPRRLDPELRGPPGHPELHGHAVAVPHTPGSSKPREQTPGPGLGANPFWSPEVRRAAELSREKGSKDGENKVPPFPPGLSGGRAYRGGGGLPGDGDEVERLRQRVMREAEEAFARGVPRLEEVGSYHTGASGDYVGPRRLDRQGWGERSMHGDPQLQETGQLGNVTIGSWTEEVLAETLRHLELPPLPTPGGESSALQFGDWLAIAFPLMSDVASTARRRPRRVSTTRGCRCRLWSASV